MFGDGELPQDDVAPSQVDGIWRHVLGLKRSLLTYENALVSWMAGTRYIGLHDGSSTTPPITSLPMSVADDHDSAVRGP